MPTISFRIPGRSTSFRLPTKDAKPQAQAKPSFTRAEIDELVDRVWGALQAAKSVMSRTADDKSWQEDKHPRAPDGRFGNKAGEHGGPKDLAGEEKPKAEDLKEKIPKRRLRELFESGHAWTEKELMEIAGIDKEATFKAFIYYMRTPKFAGAKGALDVVKDKQTGLWSVKRVEGTPAPAPAPSPAPSPAPVAAKAPAAPTPSPAPKPAPAPAPKADRVAKDRWADARVADRERFLQRHGLPTYLAAYSWENMTPGHKEAISKADVLADAPKVWVDAKTPKEAAKRLVDEGYIDAADFGRMTPENANQTARSIVEHMKDFPALRLGRGRNEPKVGYVPDPFFIGTGSAWQKHAESVKRESMTARLKEMHPDMPQEKIEQNLKYWCKKPKLSLKAWASAWDTYHGGGTGWRAISMNQSKLDAVGDSAMKFSMKHCVETRWHPQGCDTWKSVMDHEFGHQMDNLLGLSKNPEVEALLKEARDHKALGINGSALSSGVQLQQRAIEFNVSRYAATNMQEFIAESWAEYRNNPHPRPIAKKFGEIVKKEYEAKHGK